MTTDRYSPFAARESCVKFVARGLQRYFNTVEAVDVERRDRTRIFVVRFFLVRTCEGKGGRSAASRYQSRLDKVDEATGYRRGTEEKLHRQTNAKSGAIRMARQASKEVECPRTTYGLALGTNVIVCLVNIS